MLGFAGSSTARTEDYFLGPGDRLRIRVHPDDAFNVELQVRPDGTVQMPLLGIVEAAGKTPTEFADAMRDRLKGQYYQDPTVELEMLEHVAHRAYVLGGVKEPGAQAILSGDRILDLIQRAGGLTTKNIGFAYIFRRDEDAERPAVSRVSLQRILQHADFAENVVVPDGSTVYVFEDERIFVMGAVRNPGSYEVANGNSLLRAVAVAGGFSERANDKTVWIYRGNPLSGTEVNMQKLLEKNLSDPALQPGDLIFVPERFF